VTLAWYALSVSSSMHTSSDVSIANVLAAATERLRARGGDTPRLDAEILLAHVLGVGRAVLLTHPDRALTDEQRSTYDVLIERRARGEPVAYLVGARDWYDLTLQVTPDVLVPRPETEGLFERALAWARSRCVRAAVDVGTGSGALAIALARALPDATVYATDLSYAALDVARANARRIDPTLNLTFLHGDLLAPLPAAVDLIVANLPYIGEEEYTGLMSDVRLYEPRAALVGGPAGHELIAHLLDMAPARLRPGGALFLELGPPQAAPALLAARAIFPDAAIRLDDDYAGLARYLVVDTG